MTIRVDMRQVVLVIANAVDLVGVDDVLHGRRVAVMAAAFAKALGWDRGRQDLLFDAGLLHDCGVSSTRTHRHLVEELDWEGANEHCELGHALLCRLRAARAPGPDHPAPPHALGPARKLGVDPGLRRERT